jgi:hypothetical protein
MLIDRRRVRNARVTELDGRRFPSQLEARTWEALRLLEQAGVIAGLRHQVRVTLVAGIMWRVDFAYLDGPTLTPVLAEAKGFATETYLLKKKLYAAVGCAEYPGARLDIYGTRGGTVVCAETIVPDARRIGRADLVLTL